MAVVNGNPVRNDTPFEPEVTLSLGAQTLNLDNYFSDPDDDSISYALESIESDYAMVRADRIGRADNLIITPLKRGGPVSFTITASDPFGGTSTHEFEAEVGNSAPSRMGGVPALVMNQGDGPQKLVNIDSKFFDHDGDDLTYTATPSGAGGDSVATVDVDGDILTITPLARGRVDFDIAASDGHRTSGGSLILSRPHTLSVNVKVAPTIDGTPALTANEDSLYNFAPTGADADGDPLTYAIVNKPPWADFDTATGALTGTPLHEHVGITTGIVISVSEPSGAEASLPAFDITVVNVNDTPEGRPVITGLLFQSARLTATINTIRDEDGLGTFSYQWNTNDGDTNTAISGADSNTYTSTETEIGKLITVTASYTDGQGTPESLTSEPVGPIRPEATVSISGGGNVAEDDDATFTVTLSGGLPTEDVVVDYATVTGTATADDFTAASGTLTFTAGATGDDLTQSFNVKVLPDDQVEGNETFTVTLSVNTDNPLPTGFTLGTTTAQATIEANGAATVSISGGGNVAEDDDATFTVTLSGGLPTEDVVVDYATVTGTATADDFTAASGTLTFTAGATGDDLTQSFNVKVLPDDQVEGNETFTVTLSVNTDNPLPTGFTLGTTTAQATIEANGAATVSISGGGNVAEDDDATFTVTLSGGLPTEDVVVDYATVTGTATADDFTAASGTLTFTAGATGDDLTQSFNVKVLPDDQVEGNETFTVTLSVNTDNPLPTGFTLGTTTAQATIEANGAEDHDRVGRKTLVTHLASAQSDLVMGTVQNHLKALDGGNRVRGPYPPPPPPQAGRQGNGQTYGQTGGFSANDRTTGSGTGDLATGYIGIGHALPGDSTSVGYRDTRELFSQLEFHISLNSLMASDDNGRKIGPTVGKTDDGGNPVGLGPRASLSEPGTVIVWGGAGETRLDNDYNTGDRDNRYDGTVWAYNTGLDYRASEVLTLGAAIGYLDSDLSTTYNGGTYDETMLSISPYLLYESPSGLDISLFSSYGAGEVDLTGTFGQAGTPFTASTDSSLLFGAARISGTMTFMENQALEVTPNVSLLGSRKTLDRYTDSAKRTIGETTAKVLRLTPGLEVGYRFDFTGGTVTPFASGDLILDLLDTVNDDNMTYSLGGGIRLETDAGLSLSLEGQRELGWESVEQQRLVGTLSYDFPLGAEGQSGTLTPRVRLDHASGNGLSQQTSEDGLSQAYGLEYTSKDGAHRFSLDHDRSDEAGARSGLGYQYGTEIMRGVDLEATVSSPNVEEREFKGFLGMKLRF